MELCRLGYKWQSGKKIALNIPKVLAKTDCQLYQCYQVNITVHNPTALISQYGPTIGIRLYSKGTDPRRIIYLALERRYHPSQNYSHLYFSKSWEETAIEFQPSRQAKNLFLELAATTITALNISNCYFCGGTKIGDQWPWAVQKWNYSIPYDSSIMPPHKTRSQWRLKSNSCWLVYSL